MARSLILILFFASLAGPAQARLGLDDPASRWPRASLEEKIDFSNRMGKAFSALSPDFDNAYFMRCLEETTNIGNPGVLRLEAMVKACVSLRKDDPQE